MTPTATLRTLAVALVIALLPATSVAASTDEDPAYVPWPDLLPGLTTAYDPTSSNLCTAGHVRCVDAVIREMRSRLKPLVRDCDHDAVFALVYLRTTEEYRRTIEDPNFFVDTAFVNHQDAVFAKLYFDAFDAWHKGKRDKVPPAWRVLFSAAENREVSGTGNLLLGMSAHVNRDLPLALAEIGLVRPDGSSRKDDHNQVNQFLVRVGEFGGYAVLETDDLAEIEKATTIYAAFQFRVEPVLDVEEAAAAEAEGIAWRESNVPPS